MEKRSIALKYFLNLERKLAQFKVDYQRNSVPVVAYIYELYVTLNSILLKFKLT